MPSLLIDGTVLYRLYTAAKREDDESPRGGHIDQILSDYERIYYEALPGQSDLQGTLHSQPTLEHRLIALEKVEPRLLDGEADLIQRSIEVAQSAPRVVTAIQDYERTKRGPARRPSVLLGYAAKLLLLSRQLRADLWASNARLEILRAWFDEAGIALTPTTPQPWILQTPVCDFPYLPPLTFREQSYVYRLIELNAPPEDGSHVSVKSPNHSSKKKTVFVSYSHKDAIFMEQLEIHLAMMKRRGAIGTWSDRMIRPSEDWKGHIDLALEQAEIVLMLVSADFCASDYCWDVEMKRALERHANGDARVVPIAIRPCDWTGAPFSSIQGLPSNLRPVSLWPDRDAAWLDVVSGIAKLLVK